jgi:hypothetical protein
MSKRWLPLLLAGLILVAGLAVADEPAGPDEPPVRLKKKKPRGDTKPMTDPAKPDDKKKDDKKKDQPKAEPREAEPVTPQEEEKEVLQRVVKNVNSVVAKLAKNDLGEGTLQTQRDTLKDIESLINRNENPPQGGGGGGGDDKDNKEDKDQQSGEGDASKGQSGGGQKSPGNRSGQSGAGGQQNQNQQGGGEKPGTRPGNGRKPGGQQSSGTKPGGKKPGSNDKSGQDKEGNGDKPGGRDGKGGNGGKGGNKDDHVKNRNADLYKDVWGHLPETLRAQMDAYSNPQPFLPKYDDLIKRYYRTIAEQGRRKGE